MNEKNNIRAVEMVRRIRDEMAAALEGKSHAEIIEFFKTAGKRGQREPSRTTPMKRRRRSPSPGKTA